MKIDFMGSDMTNKLQLPPADGYCDGTGHRKMAALSMAGVHGDNPCKFLNHDIVK